MPDHVQLKVIVNDKDVLDRFVKEFRKEIIKKGLDKPISKSLKELKKVLFFIINEQIRNIATVDPGKPGRPIKDTNNFDQPKINIPKSDYDIVKFFTGADPNLYGKDEKFSTLQESKFFWAYNNQGSEENRRITLRMQINPGDTVESHFKQAQEFINSAVFAIPGQSGKVEFFLNPGIDLSKYIKIKCSTVGGFGDTKPKKGMSPKDRFEKDSETKGYAEWTIFQNTIDEVVKSQFIKLNDIFEPIKSGDIEGAKTVINSKGTNRALTPILEQVEKLDKKEKLSPEIQTYNNIISLIKNLKIKKKVDKYKVTYHLVSEYDEIDKKSTPFFTEMKQQIAFWLVFEQDKWFEQVVKQATQFIKKFEKSNE